MNVVLLEDELPAARRLVNLLRRNLPVVDVLAQLTSVQEAVDWFGTHPEPDLVFMDIQLSDGEVFGLFELVTLHCPVIFTTAYDTYMLEAFHNNGIEYLLKPIKEQDVALAIEKVRRFKGHFNQRLASFVSDRRIGEKQRILVRKGAAFLSIPMDQVRPQIDVPHRLRRSKVPVRSELEGTGASAPKQILFSIESRLSGPCSIHLSLWAF